VNIGSGLERGILKPRMDTDEKTQAAAGEANPCASVFIRGFDFPGVEIETERLALRAVAPRRAARRLRPPAARRESGRALCAGGVVAARPLPPPNGHAIAVSGWVVSVGAWEVGLTAASFSAPLSAFL